MKLLARSLAPLLLLALGGCATVNDMAFDRKANSVDLSKKSVVLMAVDVSRPDKSHFEPAPLFVSIQKPGAKDKKDRDNFKFNKDQDTVVTPDGHTLYLTRMALAPGHYELLAITGLARFFPISAMWQVPLATEFDVTPGSMIYIGRVTATLRSREGSEFRAGPLLPLIDQAAAGMSTSTWDVSIEDRAPEDLNLYRQTFNAIGEGAVAKSALPPFDRAAAQGLWDRDWRWRDEAKEKGQAAGTGR